MAFAASLCISLCPCRHVSLTGYVAVFREPPTDGKAVPRAPSVAALGLLAGDQSYCRLPHTRTTRRHTILDALHPTPHKPTMSSFVAAQPVSASKPNQGNTNGGTKQVIRDTAGSNGPVFF